MGKTLKNDLTLIFFVFMIPLVLFLSYSKMINYYSKVEVKPMEISKIIVDNNNERLIVYGTSSCMKQDYCIQIANDTTHVDVVIVDTVNHLTSNEIWKVIRSRVHSVGSYSIGPIYYERISFLRENGDSVYGELIL